MALRQCSAAHCGAADPEIQAACHAAGWPNGFPVPTRDENGLCSCSCSCLALDTPVQAGDGNFRAIQDFKVGDKILACGKDLAFQEKEIVFSQGTSRDSRQPFSVFLAYADTALIVTSDHLFLMPDGTLKRADRLSVNDDLVKSDGSPVRISSVDIGEFIGGFHHVATSTDSPPSDLEGRLLNTNGIISADYSTQLFYRSGELDNAFLSADHDALPIIGSPEYDARHGREERFVPTNVFNAVGVQDVEKIANDQRESKRFISMSRSRLVIPEDAVSFISDEEARARESSPKRRWNDPLSREWTEYLFEFYRAFYPDVQYQLDWANNTVNAYAWIDGGGVRHVALLGGLIRDISLELEGIALILAHELGHHYGGTPTVPNSTLACEGQSDFYGASIVMRRVWFGEAYGNTMLAAINQMAAFFGVSADPPEPSTQAGCAHPAGACRIRTYIAALDLRPKPRCAS
ncbi:hypothetical protein IQ223_19225 [Microcystis aeruginosa LEGE 00239]|uniref:M48 family metalloprotease n=1 Tax=Microcystis aeruginosa TaxID=1126 RepID=UPI001881DA04|nr:M48 family metalloprotease [Microcystis aeruginosa]MBE9246548.1 hypothetical protein [Microcystis aeruginosa LEGE 00239]